VAQEHATSELTHLLDARWKNGLLPRIDLDPHFGRYYPGIGFWHAVARRQIQSSKDVARIGGTS
jgi:hypothetical protein